MKLHQRLYVISISLLLVACGQTQKLLMLPPTLNNTHTPAHTQASGTRMSIILPDFWDNPQENAFMGYIGNDLSGIMFYEHHGKNYHEMKKSFRTGFEQAYQSVVEEMDLTINGFPAMAAYVRHNDKEDGYHILFGDSTFVAYIMTVHPNNSETVKKEIGKSLASVCYEKDANVYVE